LPDTRNVHYAYDANLRLSLATIRNSDNSAIIDYKHYIFSSIPGLRGVGRPSYRESYFLEKCTLGAMAIASRPRMHWHQDRWKPFGADDGQCPFYMKEVLDA
jgi:hypothetical protein